MKTSAILALSLMLIFSCTQVIFENPQPMDGKSLNKIPTELQGSYSFVILNEETIMEIGENFINGDDGKAYLSDSVVLKKVGNRYVVNKLITQADDETKGKWQAYVLEDKGCGFVKATSFFINSDSYVQPFLAYSKGTQVGEGQEKSIIVNATADQFNTILADDSITVSMILERIK
jgi:hypothetical protein